MLLSRPAYVHPSALSPSEFEGYAAWLEELESQISRLGRGLRIGEMLGFIRKRTPVERESEVGVGEGGTGQRMPTGRRSLLTSPVHPLRAVHAARSCPTLAQGRSSRTWELESSSRYSGW